jgi:hypothetical protein
MYFSNLQVTPAIWGNCLQHSENPMKRSREAESSIENRAGVDPLISNLRKTSEEEGDLDNWPVALE